MIKVVKIIIPTTTADEPSGLFALARKVVVASSTYGKSPAFLNRGRGAFFTRRQNYQGGPSFHNAPGCNQFVQQALPGVA